MSATTTSNAQPTPPPAPPSTPNTKIGDPTPPPHYRTQTSVERRNRSPGKQPTPSKITPHDTYPTPSCVSCHGITRVQVSPPFLENPPSPYPLPPAISNHPRVAHHPIRARARNLCGRVCSIMDVQGGGGNLQLLRAGKGLLRSSVGRPYFSPL